MCIRVAVDDAFCLCDAGVDAFPLFPRGVPQAKGGVPRQLELAVPVTSGVGQVGIQPVVTDVQRRQAVSLVRKAQVGRLLQEQPPRRAPDPELPLPAGVEGQVVGLGAIPLEKPRESLAGVHDLKETCVVDKFFVPVGRRGGRIDQLIPDALELVQEHLVGLAAETAQGGCLVQAHGREAPRVNVSIPHSLIVGHEDGGVRGVRLGHVPDVDRRGHVQQIFGVVHKFPLDVEGQDDERLAAGVFLHQPAPLKLHGGLAEAEPGEQRPPAAPHGPQHAGALVWLQYRVQLAFVYLKPGQGGNVDFLFQKLLVGHLITPRYAADGRCTRRLSPPGTRRIRPGPGRFLLRR